MLKGLKTRLFLYSLCLFFIFITNLNAGWLEIEILHNNKRYVNISTIDVNVKTHELIAIKFTVHYKNKSAINYNCWVRDGFYGSNKNKYQFPEYTERWKDKNTTLPPQQSTTLENIVYIHPTYTSRDTVYIWYGDNEITRYQIVVINVKPSDAEPPVIEKEPEFTPGTANTIKWYPLDDSFVQDVYYFDDADPFNLRKAAQRLYKKTDKNKGAYRNTVFENLQDGHKYGYFVRSEVVIGNDTLLLCSDCTYSIQDNTAPEKVTVIQAFNKGDKIELAWKKVSDEISEVEKYVIFRKTDNQKEISVDTVLSSSTQEDVIRWFDDSLEKDKTSFYRVKAVDIVGNMGDGVRSNSVYFTGEGGDENDSGDDNEDADRDEDSFGDDYIKGSIDTLWIELDLEKTVQALRFESVRDSSRYFDSKPYSNMRYFSSGWVNPKVLRNQGWVSKSNPDSVFFVFDYTDTENARVNEKGVFQNNSDSEYIDLNFVNGRTYIRRILLKYELSQDTVELNNKIPDCFAPSDIHNLIGEIVLMESLPEYSQWCMNLSWEKAHDEVTGVKQYLVWRKIEKFEDNFVNIDTTFSPEFIDTLNISADGILLNPLISYKISSEDYLGNKREVNESDWEFQRRSLQGPEISFTDSGPEIRFSQSRDTLYTKKDIVAVGINRYNINDVVKYEIDVNGTLQSIKNLNRNTDTLEVDLSGDEVSVIKVRAVYVGNVSSLWSNTLTVVRNFNRAPINLKAVNDSINWEGNIKLNWNRSSLDAVGYDIFRDGNKVATIQNREEYISWIDYYGKDELKNKPGDTLIAYHDYDYSVKAIDVFQQRSNATEDVTIYCNRAPEVVFDEKKYQDNDYFIRIGWRRVIPSKLQTGDVIKYEVKIYQDSLSNFYQGSDIVYTIDGKEFFEDFRVISNHNYIFRIRGIPNAYPTKPSAWSKPYTVPDFSLFDSLESLALPGKKIFIYWNNSEIIKKYKIDSFQIIREADNTQDKTWNFSSDSISFIDNSRNLIDGKDYTYTIKAIDTLNQILDEREVTVTCDKVAFIPNIDMINTPKYFSQDSLQVFWKWINDITGDDITEGTEGADSLLIQLSISNKFPPIAEQTVTTDYFQADSNKSRKVIIPALTSQKNSIIFIRITAKDKWAHNDISSPKPWWSDDFYPLKSAFYDTVSSPGVIDFEVKYNGPYNYGSDSIVVEATWSDTLVKQGIIDTNRSIQWNAKSFRIIRRLDDEEWIQDEIPIDTTDTLKNYVYHGYTLNRDYEWQINVVDSAENITEGDLIKAENFLATPSPPEPIEYKKCIILKNQDVDSLEYFLEIALDSSHFALAYEDVNLKDRLLCSIGWTVSDTCSCETGWGSIRVDTTWFRVKARKNNEQGEKIESAWSLLAAFMDNSSDNKGLTGIEESNNKLFSFDLHPNKPNPFNSTTEIRYEIPEQSDVSISIFNMKGSLVKRFTRNNLSPGNHSLFWDGTDMNDKNVSSGIYISFLTAETISGKLWRNEIKMLLIK